MSRAVANRGERTRARSSGGWANGFVHVVVGTELQALDLVGRVVAGGQHDRRRRRNARIWRRSTPEAVEVREARVEEDDVRRSSFRPTSSAALTGASLRSRPCRASGAKPRRTDSTTSGASSSTRISWLVIVRPGRTWPERAPGAPADFRLRSRRREPARSRGQSGRPRPVPRPSLSDRSARRRTVRRAAPGPRRSIPTPASRTTRDALRPADLGSTVAPGARTSARSTGLRKRVLRKPAAIPVDGTRMAGRVHHEGLAGLGEEGRDGRGRLASELRCIEAAPLERDPALSEAGEVEQVGDEALHSIRVPFDREQQLAPLLIGRLAGRVEEEPARGPYRGQRRPELMGDGCEQVRSEPLERIQATTDRSRRERRSAPPLQPRVERTLARPAGIRFGRPRASPRSARVPEERGCDVRGGSSPTSRSRGSRSSPGVAPSPSSASVALGNAIRGSAVASDASGVSNVMITQNTAGPPRPRS